MKEKIKKITQIQISRKVISGFIDSYIEFSKKIKSQDITIPIDSIPCTTRDNDGFILWETKYSVDEKVCCAIKKGVINNWNWLYDSNKNIVAFSFKVN